MLHVHSEPWFKISWNGCQSTPPIWVPSSQFYSIGKQLLAILNIQPSSNFVTVGLWREYFDCTCIYSRCVVKHKIYKIQYWGRGEGITLLPCMQEHIISYYERPTLWFACTGRMSPRVLNIPCKQSTARYTWNTNGNRWCCIEVVSVNGLSLIAVETCTTKNARSILVAIVRAIITPIKFYFWQIVHHFMCYL